MSCSRLRRVLKSRLCRYPTLSKLSQGWPADNSTIPTIYFFLHPNFLWGDWLVGKRLERKGLCFSSKNFLVDGDTRVDPAISCNFQFFKAGKFCSPPAPSLSLSTCHLRSSIPFIFTIYSKTPPPQRLSACF